MSVSIFLIHLISLFSFHSQVGPFHKHRIPYILFIKFPFNADFNVYFLIYVVYMMKQKTYLEIVTDLPVFCPRLQKRNVDLGMPFVVYMHICAFF
jgi:hypothetical protein